MNKKRINVLNLYAGIGGNRKLWKNVNVTAVELNADIAKIYQAFYPKDTVLVVNAHEYLERHYKEFDFIWSSPPCQSHSSFRKNICVRYRGTKAIYPDMRLYEEILFLRHHAKCNWVIENVKPYYVPLVEPDFVLQRHYFWSNKHIENKVFSTDLIRKAQIPDLQKKYGFNLDTYKLKNKRQILRNCVSPEIGAYVLKSIRSLV